MTVKISGVLKDGTGKPVQNCTIVLKARRTSSTVVVNTVASENPDEAGRYSMDVEHGQYSVTLLVEGFPPSHAGTINGHCGGTGHRRSADTAEVFNGLLKTFYGHTSPFQRRRLTAGGTPRPSQR